MEIFHRPPTAKGPSETFTGDVWVDGVYAGSAGCHPAGSVIGAAGHNAAVRILTDLGVAPAAG